MQKLKVYEYSGCSTCKKALKYLEGRKLPFEKIAIVTQPPTLTELRSMLKDLGSLHKLFNTSGELYRKLGVKDKLPKMSQEDALALLHKNGKLIKRPFVVGGKRGLVGFKEAEWKENL